MDARIPPLLQPLLQDFSRRLAQDLPGRVSALYLEGSLALDGFNPRLSDIDFIAVLSGPVEPADFEQLLAIHQAIVRQYPSWKLSGMYFQAGDLGCQERASQPFLKYHDGRLTRADQFKLSSVTWWILKHRGITVFGPPAQALAIQVDMDHLLEVQRENLNTYWGGWTKQPIRLLALLTNWAVQWTVLGVLRQFYTLRERQIISKVKAGEYALGRLPERWHGIIREAISLREDPQKSGYRSRIGRAVETYRFLKYVIKVCNETVPCLHPPTTP